jgi:hypothetical protein
MRRRADGADRHRVRRPSGRVRGVSEGGGIVARARRDLARGAADQDVRGSGAARTRVGGDDVRVVGRRRRVRAYLAVTAREREVERVLRGARWSRAAGVRGVRGRGSDRHRADARGFVLRARDFPRDERRLDRVGRRASVRSALGAVGPPPEHEGRVVSCVRGVAGRSVQRGVAGKRHRPRRGGEPR